MSEPIYHANHLVITKKESEKGFKLLGGNFDFAIVQTSNENQIRLIPLNHNLKVSNVKFEAFEILRFRSGKFPLKAPWIFIVAVVGLHKITVKPKPKFIELSKLPEFDWSDILPELKEVLKVCRELLLKKESLLN